MAEEGETTTPEPTTAPDPIAQLRAEFEARIESVTKKYNGEFASLRKRSGEGGGETPKPAALGQAPAAGLTAEETFAIARKIARAEARVSEAHRAMIEERCEGKSLSQQAEIWDLAAIFQGDGPPKATEARDAQPGRDARPQPSARGQGPATRSADAFPATKAEWMAIVRDPDKTRLNKFMPQITDGTFNPDVLK